MNGCYAIWLNNLSMASYSDSKTSLPSCPLFKGTVWPAMRYFSLNYIFSMIIKLCHTVACSCQFTNLGLLYFGHEGYGCGKQGTSSYSWKRGSRLIKRTYKAGFTPQDTTLQPEQGEPAASAKELPVLVMHANAWGNDKHKIDASTTMWKPGSRKIRYFTAPW